MKKFDGMTKDEEKELRKAFTFENFKKLLYFVNCCAGEGLQLGKVWADDLEYDILAEVSEDVWEAIDKEAYQFLGIEEEEWNKNFTWLYGRRL